MGTSATTRLIVQGGIAGLVGGVVFGIMMAMMGMLPMVGMLVGQESAVVGFIVLHKAWEQVEDKVSGLCRYCARAFDVYERAVELDLPFLAEFEQHPSLRSRVADGYQIITF